MMMNNGGLNEPDCQDLICEAFGEFFVLYVFRASIFCSFRLCFMKRICQNDRQKQNIKNIFIVNNTSAVTVFYFEVQIPCHS